MTTIRSSYFRYTLVILGIAILFFIGIYYQTDFVKNSPNSEKPFVIVIPSYKNKEWYRQNLDSVFAQQYHNFRVIYIDDASPDGTGELVENYIKEKNQTSRVHLIKNKERLGAMANHYRANWLCKPNEIVVNLDGDDWFANDNVLQRLNEVYSDSNVWVTYGSFVFYPSGIRGWADQVPSSTIESNSIREYSWVTTLLRTFYAGLFQKIKQEDFLYEGKFFQMTCDLAMMFPIVEMAGTHCRFIPDILYVYNVSTSMNDHILDPGFQQHLNLFIRGKEKYLPIEQPF